LTRAAGKTFPFPLEVIFYHLACKAVNQHFQKIKEKLSTAIGQGQGG
jgi:hypothetical protein